LLLDNNFYISVCQFVTFICKGLQCNRLCPVAKHNILKFSIEIHHMHCFHSLSSSNLEAKGLISIPIKTYQYFHQGQILFFLYVFLNNFFAFSCININININKHWLFTLTLIQLFMYIYDSCMSWLRATDWVQSDKSGIIPIQCSNHSDMAKDIPIDDYMNIIIFITI